MLANLAKLIVALIITNICFAIAMYNWVTDEDMRGLRKKKSERFADLFYFSVVSFSTAGYGDISAKSTRAKIAVSLFLLFVNVAAIYGIYNAIVTK